MKMPIYKALSVTKAKKGILGIVIETPTVSTWLELSIAGVPARLYSNQWCYGGVFEPDPKKVISINIPGNELNADKVVILYILLHEHAHYKQSIESKCYPDLLADYYLGKKIDGGVSHSLERAANKYAMNIMTRLGISPSVIAERLNKNLLQTYNAEALCTYNRWARRYFRSVTP